MTGRLTGDPELAGWVGAGSWGTGRWAAWEGLRPPAHPGGHLPAGLVTGRELRCGRSGARQPGTARSGPEGRAPAAPWLRGCTAGHQSLKHSHGLPARGEGEGGAQGGRPPWPALGGAQHHDLHAGGGGHSTMACPLRGGGSGAGAVRAPWPVCSVLGRGGGCPALVGPKQARPPSSPGHWEAVDSADLLRSRGRCDHWAWGWGEGSAGAGGGTKVSVGASGTVWSRPRREGWVCRCA